MNLVRSPIKAGVTRALTALDQLFCLPFFKGIGVGDLFGYFGVPRKLGKLPTFFCFLEVRSLAMEVAMSFLNSFLIVNKSWEQFYSYHNRIKTSIEVRTSYGNSVPLVINWSLTLYLESSLSHSGEIMDAVKHKLHEAFKSAVESVTTARTISAFKDRGVLTPEEFVAAGNNLVEKCPTWSWWVKRFDLSCFD